VFAGFLTAQAVLLPVMAVVTLFVPLDQGQSKLQTVGILGVWFAFAAYFGPGLWRGSALARRAFFAMCLVAAAAGVVATFVEYQGTSGLVVATSYVGLSNLIGCGIFWWYLYMKPNVREFFEHRSTRIASAA
jgi:hypothetical protein